MGQRTAPRRVERRAAAAARFHLSGRGGGAPNAASPALEEPPAPENVLAFLNRLSDLLFALARVADQQSGRADRVLGG